MALRWILSTVGAAIAASAVILAPAASSTLTPTVVAQDEGGYYAMVRFDGVAAGPEFLVWFPDEGDTHAYADALVQRLNDEVLARHTERLVSEPYLSPPIPRIADYSDDARDYPWRTQEAARQFQTTSGRMVSYDVHGYGELESPGGGTSGGVTVWARTEAMGLLGCYQVGAVPISPR